MTARRLMTTTTRRASNILKDRHCSSSLLPCVCPFSSWPLCVVLLHANSAEAYNHLSAGQHYHWCAPRLAPNSLKTHWCSATAIPKITDQFNSLDDVGWYGSAYVHPQQRDHVTNHFCRYLLTTSAFQLLFGRFYSFLSIKWVCAFYVRGFLKSANDENRSSSPQSQYSSSVLSSVVSPQTPSPSSSVGPSPA